MPWRAACDEHRRQVPDEQLAKVLQLLHHLAGGEPPRRGHPAVVLAHAEPDRCCLPPKRADHLGHDVEEEPELPLDRGRAVSWRRR